MLYKIARKIKTDYLDSVSFADRTGGLVRAMKDSRKTEKVYPIEFNQDKVLGDAQYMRRLVPDSTKKSVMYFEMGSAPTVIDRHNNWYECEATLKLVCWFNYQEVDPDMYDPTYLISEIIQAIPFKIGNFECLAGVTCTYAGQDENDGSIFSEYNYNEAETQFFKYPYDYFVLNFDIGYRVVTNCYDEGLSEVPVDPVLIAMSGDDAKALEIFGVSGKEYQTYGYASDDTVLSARALHEFSGEYQSYTITPKAGLASYFSIDYGREYLRALDMSDQDITCVTIPDDDNIRLEYVDLSDNAITSEQCLIDLVQHCYDTGVNDGDMDISGGTNAYITDATTISNITTMVDDRGWTITYNEPISLVMNIGSDGGVSYGYRPDLGFGTLTPSIIDGSTVSRFYAISVSSYGYLNLGGNKISGRNNITIRFDGLGDVPAQFVAGEYRYDTFDTGLGMFMFVNIGNDISLSII